MNEMLAFFRQLSIMCFQNLIPSFSLQIQLLFSLLIYLRAGHYERKKWYMILTGLLGLFLVYGICFFRFAPLLMEDGEKQRTSRQGLTTTLSALAIAIILSALAQQISSESRNLYQVCMVYGMVCCFYVLWDQAARKNQKNLEDELEVSRQTFQKYKDQYQMSQENVALINRKCHDLKHQIAALRHIKDEASRSEQISNLENSVMIYDSIVHTGNIIM